MRAIGIETEYGVSATLRTATGRRRLGPDEVARQLFRPVVAEHSASNVFLRNGGRLYLDVGSHAEYATAECGTLTDLLAQDRAGDGILVALAATAEQSMADEGEEAVFQVFKNNVDSHGNAYGTHENYQIPRALALPQLAAGLAGFLVARQLLCGAGRVVREGHGWGFSVSQRADVLGDPLSQDTTRSRPLINTRDEPHADPARFRRLHVIAGDANLSEASTLVKIVSTDLVLRLAETGRLDSLARWAPAGSGEAIRVVSRDVQGRAAYDLATGGRACGLDVLTALLVLVDESLAAGDLGELDPLAERGIEVWRRAVTALDEREPDHIADAVDWAAKRRLLGSFAARHDLAPGDLRLLQLDLAYHQIAGGTGAFAVLERSGQVPRYTTEADVQAATSNPPPTRARLRSRLIAAAQGSQRPYSVDWGTFSVHDLKDGALTLPDPLAAEASEADALLELIRTEPRHAAGAPAARFR